MLVWEDGGGNPAYCPICSYLTCLRCSLLKDVQGRWLEHYPQGIQQPLVGWKFIYLFGQGDNLVLV